MAYGGVSLLKRLEKNVLNASRLRQVLSLVLFLLVWTVFLQLTPGFAQVPSPYKVFMALFTLKFSIFHDISLSFFRIGVGFILGILIGLPFGILIGYSRIFNNLLFPAVELIRPIPPIAWIPLAVLFFVNTEARVIYLTFYGAFFPIVYNTLGGISSVDIRYVRAAISFGVNKRQLLLKVILPSAMPQIFAGLKIAIAITWLMVVASEMIVARGGLGYMVWYNHTVMNYPMVILGMGIIGACGALCSVAIDFIGKRFMRWREIF